MKNIQIGAALKTMRKNRGWTIHDVVVQLKKPCTDGKAIRPILARKHCCCSVNCIRVTHSPEISCTSLQTNPSRSLQMNGMSSKCIAGIRNYRVPLNACLMFPSKNLLQIKVLISCPL